MDDRDQLIAECIQARAARMRAEMVKAVAMAAVADLRANLETRSALLERLRENLDSIHALAARRPGVQTSADPNAANASLPDKS